MPERLDVIKTYKLFIDGKFPRSESGRTLAIQGADGRLLAHVCKASRKDLRDAVTAARGGLAKWKNATAYNRGQVLYRMAEMLEGKRDEFVRELESAAPSDAKAKRASRSSKNAAPRASEDVQASIDRLVHYAGWADKFAQVLGCNNQVAGPYYNFTVPEATGVVAVVAPDAPALLGMITLLAPAICAGNACVVVAGQAGSAQLAAAVMGEVIATSDVPAGVVNLLTGDRAELLPIVASHRDIDAVHAAGLPPEHAHVLREGAAENLKRVRVLDIADPATSFFDPGSSQGAWWIEPFVEMKTIWHPSAS